MNPATLFMLVLGAASGEAVGPPLKNQPELPPAVATAQGPRGWIGIGGRNAIGLTSHLDPDFGAEVIAGMWLLGEHLQPLAKLGWSRGFGDGLSIDALRLGVGLAGGAALAHEHLWLGAAIEADLVQAHARSDAGLATSVGAALGVSGLLEGRILQRFLFGVEFGPQFSLPSIQFAGATRTIEWGPFRFNAGLRLGVILGPAIGLRANFRRKNNS